MTEYAYEAVDTGERNTFEGMSADKFKDKHGRTWKRAHELADAAFLRSLNEDDSDSAVMIVHEHDYVSGALPRWCPGAKEFFNKPGHPDHGKPIVRNRRDADNIAAATGFQHGRDHSDRARDWDIQSQFPERND